MFYPFVITFHTDFVCGHYKCVYFVLLSNANESELSKPNVKIPMPEVFGGWKQLLLSNPKINVIFEIKEKYGEKDY